MSSSESGRKGACASAKTSARAASAVRGVTVTEAPEPRARPDQVESAGDGAPRLERSRYGTQTQRLVEAAEAIPLKIKAHVLIAERLELADNPAVDVGIERARHFTAGNFKP